MQAVKNCFEPGSLLQAQAALLAELLMALPARRYEPVFMRLCDFNPSTRILAFAPSGFSHLKGTSRALMLDVALAAKVHAVRDRISAADPRREYFFLDPDNSGSKAADEILAVITECLRRLTGEASIRVHSLRGSSETYIAYPELDGLLRAMAENRAPDADPRPIAARCRAITWAAFQAGHHPITEMQCYFSAWPIVAHAHRRQFHATWRPSGHLADRMPGLSRNAVRQMISRRGRAGGDVWEGLGNWAVDRIGARLLEDCLVTDSAPPLEVTGPQPVAEESMGNLTRYIAFRLLSFPTIKALDLARVSAWCATQVDAFLSSMPPLAIPRLGDGAVVMLASDFGSSVASRLASQTDAGWLLAVVESLREAERSVPTPVADIELAATRLSDCLPPSHTVAVLPEAASNIDAIAMQIRAAVPTFLLKEASRKVKRRYRLLVTPLRVRSARSAGECTGVVHLLLLSRLGALFFMRSKNHDKEV